MILSRTQGAFVFQDVVAGDRWDQTITFARASTDFTTVAIACKLKDDPEGTLKHTFTLTPTFPDPTDLTTFTTTLSLSGAETTAIGAMTLYGDVVISMAAFGPYTPIRFQFNITTRVTV